MGRYLILLLMVLVMPVREATATSPYSAYGLPGEAQGIRFKVFAYSDEKASEVLTRAEETYKKLLLTLGQGGMMFKDCLIFFWKDRNDFLKESSKLSKDTVSEWAGAFTTYHFERGKVAIFAYESPDIFSNILPHEITHQVLAQGLCFTGTPHLPNWLNEGVAQYMEEDKESRHLLISSAVKENRYIDLKELTSAYTYPDENVSLFYAQSLSLVEYSMENYTGERFYSLARRLVQEKMPIEKALKGAYWPDIETVKDLEEKWLTWLRGKHYYQKVNQTNSAERVTQDGEYPPLTSRHKEIIKEMEKKIEKSDRGYIWRSPHFTIRIEYLSRSELGIKKPEDLRDIYGAILFILEEAYDKLGGDMGYRPAGKLEVYLYAPKQYAILKGDRSHEEMVSAHQNEIVIEIKKNDGIRADVASFLYHCYTHIALLNKGESMPYIKLHEPVAVEWERKGERISAWNKSKPH